MTDQTVSSLQAVTTAAVRHIHAQARQIDALSEALDWIMQRVEQPADLPAHMLPALGLARDRAAALRNNMPSMEVAASEVVTFPRPGHGGPNGFQRG